jgi:hypothetical protein
MIDNINLIKNSNMANEGNRNRESQDKKTANKEQDTSRTSNQGRKLASGGDTEKRGNPEIDENTNSPKSDKSGKKA